MIERYRFGTIVIDSRMYHADLKIVAGRVVADWWRREGHRVDVEDVEDVLEAGPAVLVVGMGLPGRMLVSPELRVVLEEARIELIEEPTPDAVRFFNQLSADKRKVAGAFHLTC